MINVERIFLLFFVFIGSYSCNDNSNKEEQSGPLLYDQPKSFPLKTGKGYVVNSSRGDTIKVLINSLGDTIQSGIKIKLIPKIVNTDTCAQPLKVLVTKREISDLNSFTQKTGLRSPSKNIFFNDSSIQRIPFKLVASTDTSHYILNSEGRKIKTGVELELRYKKVQVKFPKPFVSLPPIMKENASKGFLNLDVDQGLNSSYVLSIMEDHMGRIWFATANGGVNIYDGKTIMQIGKDQGLPNNIIYSILQGKDKNIWIGTWGNGICKFDGESFIHFDEEVDFPLGFITNIFEDSKGNIWFGSVGKGVAKYDGSKFIIYTVKEGLSHNIVNRIAEDRSGNIWFATEGTGLCRFDGKEFLRFDESTKIFGPSRSVYVMNDNKILVGTYENGLGIIELKEPGGNSSVFSGVVTFYKHDQGFSDNVAYSMKETNDGLLWIGTWGDGIFYYDGEKFINYKEKDGLPNNIICKVFEDKSGGIWFGTYGSGVSRLGRRQFSNLSESDGLPSNHIWSILEARDKTIWIGTDGKGAAQFDGERFKYLSKENGLVENTIWDMVQTSEGSIWFATNGGASLYDGESIKVYGKSEGLPSDKLYCILEDSKGNIWFGTQKGGACMYDGKMFYHYGESEGFLNNMVFKIREDKFGNIWMATPVGITKFDGNHFTFYTQKEGMPSSDINTIYADANGNIWIGTSGDGCSMFNGKSFTNYSIKEGLPNDIVWSFIQDANGYVWVGTDGGLCRIDYMQQKQGKPSIIRFSKSDGIKGFDFYWNSVIIDGKNQAWWGTGKGITKLPLDDFIINESSPKIFLSHLEINNTYIDFRNLPDSIREAVEFENLMPFKSFPEKFSLSHEMNHITFHYSAIDWNAPHKIKYQYMIEGFDRDWNEITNENFADYRNIPYGTYTFKVRAIGESQKWSEPFEYTFTIHPPWWHTTWFRIIYISCFLLLLYLIFRWRTTALRKQKLILEKTVRKRTAEVMSEKKIVEEQKEIIEEKHKEITDSINYAERIQRSFLATKYVLDENLGEYFVFFQPKEAVSGDFYWASKLINENFAYACADSTGHGVPGAIMSILNISSLELAVKEKLTEPSAIFNFSRKEIIERLKKDGSTEGGKDGMDASLIVLNKEKTKLIYAAANNPVWILRNQEIVELYPDKMPVGKHDKDSIPFTQHEIDLQKGDLIYSFTDGMPDQFGGPKGKKYKYAKMKEFLISISNLAMSEQKEKLKMEFENWKGDLEQVDDVCIIGIRI